MIMFLGNIWPRNMKRLPRGIQSHGCTTQRIRALCNIWGPRTWTLDEFAFLRLLFKIETFVPRTVIDENEWFERSDFNGSKAALTESAIEITQNPIRKTAKPEGITQNSTATTESFPVPPRGRTGCMVRAPLVRPVSEPHCMVRYTTASLESIRALLSLGLAAWSETLSFNRRPSPAAWSESSRAPHRAERRCMRCLPALAGWSGQGTASEQYPLHVCSHKIPIRNDL